MKGKRWIAIVLLLGMLVSENINVTKACEKERLCDYIVMSLDNQDISSVVEDYGEVKDALKETNMAVVRMTEKEAKELKREDDSVVVERDSEITASSIRVKKTKKRRTEWNIKAINATKSNKKQIKSKVKVAVIDSGVDNYNDITLAESINLISGEEEVSPLYLDVSGHGSSVASIIAAEDNDNGITGIAPEVELYSAKVLDGQNRSTVSRVVDAIYWAIKKKVNIINMSFGTSKDSPALHQAVKDANKEGILLVAAAGNCEQVEYPAAYQEVMAVGSVNACGKVSEASAKGKELEIVAPGEQICATGAFGGTIIASGTSMSAPHITGVAAKLWEKDRTVSAEFIRQLIDASANQFASSNACGNGLVDYSFAEKIYDDFKNCYVEGSKLEKNEQTVEKNSAEIKQFPDVDYVEGRWNKDDHDKAITNSKLTKTQISIVKSGVVYPDINSATKGLDKRPYWHGGYKCSNYISSYIYATNIAMALKSGKSASSASVPAGLSASDKSNMLNTINGFKWTQLLATPSGKNRSLFVWGMAIHTAMDVYSHSAWGNFSGTWRHLDHATNSNPVNGMADRTDGKAFPGRYTTACDVAKKSLATYVSGSTGKVSDFLPSNSYSCGGSYWKIRNLYSFAATLDGNTANSLKKYSY